MSRSSACRLDSSKNYEWNSESGSVFHVKHRLDLFIFVPKSVAENTEDIPASTTVQYLYFSFTARRTDCTFVLEVKQGLKPRTDSNSCCWKTAIWRVWFCDKLMKLSVV